MKNKENKQIKVEELDHLVLTVVDPEATCRFYEEVLGMHRKVFRGKRLALHFGSQKLNLHQTGRKISPVAVKPTPGSADICFLTQVPLSDFCLHLEERGVEVEEGPVERTGASGPILSIYFRDPDGNLIEVSNLLKREV